jgi:hypothetical protein
MPIPSLSFAPVFCYTGRGRVYESNATPDLPLLKESTILPCQGHDKLLLSSDVGP